MSADRADVNSIVATMALAKRGPSMLRAKRAIETVLDSGEVAIELEKVESREALAADLSAVGFRASFLPRPEKAANKEGLSQWVRDVRQRSGLTQEQFAITYGFEVKTLRKYEQGESTPAAAVMSYLRTIGVDPVAVKQLRLKSGAAF